MTTNYDKIPDMERRNDLKEATDKGIEAVKAIIPPDARATLIVTVDNAVGQYTQSEISATSGAQQSQTDLLFVLNSTLGTLNLIEAALRLARYYWRGPGEERYQAAVGDMQAFYARPSAPPSDSPAGTPASSASSHASPAASESPPDGDDAAHAPASRGSAATA